MADEAHRRRFEAAGIAAGTAEATARNRALSEVFAALLDLVRGVGESERVPSEKGERTSVC